MILHDLVVMFILFVRNIYVCHLIEIVSIEVQSSEIETKNAFKIYYDCNDEVKMLLEMT